MPDQEDAAPRPAPLRHRAVSGGKGPSGRGLEAGDGTARGRSRGTSPPPQLRIGVLAVQGDFAEHAEALRRAGAAPVEVRLPAQLSGLHGLIIPGGESTTIGKLLADWGLLQALHERIGAGFPVWGTCAGAILLARDVCDALPGQPLLRVMDIAVRRNAFGRQLQSFEMDLDVPALGRRPFHAVFIRAPKIEAVGPQAEALARLPDGTIVAARQGALLATSFHPELTPDPRFHRLFLAIARQALASPPGQPVR
jgi:5'-phosphate synthase pdxT subunit